MKTLDVIPSAEKYVEALKAIHMSEAQRKMLMFHYNKSPHRTVTYTELAKAAEYDSYSAANLHYGKLGKALGEKLGIEFEPLWEGNPDSNFFSSAISTSNKYEDTEYMLIMHPELAKAIQVLGW